ncbi:MAG: phytanoyl-CoA dioxygenase family protein [Pseudomonadota bacterium]
MNTQFALTASQVEHFRTEGWLALDTFWTPNELRAIRQELQRLQDENKLRNVATDGDGKTPSAKDLNLQLVPMSPHSRLFATMPFAPKAAHTAAQLIGQPMALHLDQVFLKPARHGSGTNWHQDNAYFKLSHPMHGTAMWTAVHDASKSNGTLRVIPHTFHEKLEHGRDPMSDHHIRCYPDESRAVDVEVPAGGVVFFCYGTPHATGPNMSNEARAGIAIHYLRYEEVERGAALMEHHDPKKRLVVDAEGVTGRPDKAEEWARLTA